METAVEQRVDRLETIFGQFMTQTNRALLRMEKRSENLHQEMMLFKNEMREFKNVMLDFKDDMLDFKNEMNGFKDRMESETKRFNKQLGELANRMGTIVEDIAAPAIPRIAGEYFGCDEIEDFMVRRWKRKANDKKSRREFDVIAVCPDRVLLCEVKSTPRPDYINDFIELLQKEEFYEYFPEYREKQLIPIFSSLYLPPDIVIRLSKNGIFALGMMDSVMDILNYEECNYLRGKDVG
jgi:hypothetical protein